MPHKVLLCTTSSHGHLHSFASIVESIDDAITRVWQEAERQGAASWPSVQSLPSTRDLCTQVCSKKLGVMEDELEEALCFRTVTVMREDIKKTLNVKEAGAACNALCMRLHDIAFNWSVEGATHSLSIHWHLGGPAAAGHSCCAESQSFARVPHTCTHQWTLPLS